MKSSAEKKKKKKKKNLCNWYFFKLSQLVEAIQMSTHSICFYKEVDKCTQAVI